MRTFFHKFCFIFLSFFFVAFFVSQSQAGTPACELNRKIIFGGLNWAGVNTGVISARRAETVR